MADQVRVLRCASCQTVVGKVGTVVSAAEIDGVTMAKVNFGRGRPQLGRPEFFPSQDLEVINNETDAGDVSCDEESV